MDVRKARRVINSQGLNWLRSIVGGKFERLVSLRLFSNGSDRHPGAGTGSGGERKGGCSSHRAHGEMEGDVRRGAWRNLLLQQGSAES